jgi:hypothetical protein
VIGRRPAVAAYRVIDEDELLGGSDWLEPAPERRLATRRPRRLRVAACAMVLAAIAAGLLTGARTAHPVSRRLPPAAPPLTRPVAEAVRPAPAIQHAPRVRAADRRHPVLRMAVTAAVPHAGALPPPAPPPSAAQEFGFER